MAVLTIKVVPEKILRTKAKKVNIIDRSIQKLLDDMVETMDWANGVGLAAPQVGVPLKAIVLGMPGEKPLYIINPEIVKKGEEITVEEGCLSIPGFRGEIKRCVSVTVKGLDYHGKPLRLKATELFAQALQHEIDHVNGVLYIDHLESPDKLFKITSRDDEN
ncbi:MAG: peptide deformylase [Dehalococcoidia bacterium]|nr:peptide deformylase [Dehalococcoidia bacterium]